MGIKEIEEINQKSRNKDQTQSWISCNNLHAKISKQLVKYVLSKLTYLKKKVKIIAERKKPKKYQENSHFNIRCKKEEYRKKQRKYEENPCFIIRCRKRKRQKE